ncbi:LuxR C-terminal-related transcriptional regulator [Streptomyces sp. NPDC005820]|uniref:response regulator transcription factor n=1 Tax=Streptomyces sp. NPDC005820 TaxID=3157069 RepID=UPI0033F05DE3
MTVRVLLADDQALLRGTFRLLIDSCEDLEVVGEAANGAEAVDLARALITRFLAAPAPGALLASPERLATLTPREREVTALAARGRSNDEIAGELVLSVLTVRSHIQRSLTKLGARDRAQLVVIAYQTGLVRPAGP